MKTEIIPLDNKGVTLTAYLLDAADDLSNAKIHPAVLIFPGGGYYRCSDREAEPVLHRIPFWNAVHIRRER